MNIQYPKKNSNGLEYFEFNILLANLTVYLNNFRNYLFY
jgi:hypothetical protein